MTMEEGSHRISLVIREDQYERLSQAGVNVSGFIRDLIDDHYSRHSVTINVTEETRALYDQLVSNAADGDKEIEPYLRQALRLMLQDRIRRMEKLAKELDRA